MKDINDINYIHKCSSCGIEKPNSEYGKVNQKNRKRLFRSRCVECLRKDSKKNYSTEKSRNKHFKRVYKIDIFKYNELFKNQGGKCLICEKHFESDKLYSKERLVVDHCHITGKVRGLLCCNCNTAIGMMNENINSLKNAIIYLLKSNENNCAVILDGKLPINIPMPI